LLRMQSSRIHCAVARAHTGAGAHDEQPCPSLALCQSLPQEQA
jgi:hypothetical protein